jgi:hypothetical protein
VKKWMLLLLLSVTVSAQLTYTDYMELNDYLLFMGRSTYEITHVPLSSRSQKGSFPCSTYTADLYINYSEDNLPCACPCPSAVIGCPLPFHVFRKPFNEIDLCAPLELSDTALFMKIDTVPDDEFTGGCALPYIIRNKGDIVPDVLVLKTTKGGYALVYMTQKTENVTCGGAPEGTSVSAEALHGYKVTWYLDYTGKQKPDFTWVDQTHLQSPRNMAPAVTPPARAAAGSTLYTLHGRKVSTPRSGAYPKALFIVRTASGVLPVLR